MAIRVHDKQGVNIPGAQRCNNLQQMHMCHAELRSCAAQVGCWLTGLKQLNGHTFSWWIAGIVVAMVALELMTFALLATNKQYQR